MSEHITFSAGVKQELMGHSAKKREGLMAELAVYIAYFGRIIDTPHGVRIYLETENEYVAKRYAQLLKRCFNVVPEVGFMRFRSTDNLEGGSVLYGVVVKNSKDAGIIYYSLHNIETDGFGRLKAPFVHESLLKSSNCLRAFIRGAFISAGTISNPNKSYHFEISTTDEGFAGLINKVIGKFDVSGKIIKRKNSYVVYIKEADFISDMLNIMDAHCSMMEFENIRILHNIANQINRQTNCEVANSQKTVSAATKQVEDILLIQKFNKFSALPDTLKELAVLRLEHRETPLKDLGEMLDPPIGKSGVNHRMRKLAQIAEDLRLIK